MRKVLGLILLLGLQGCELLQPTVCTLEALPGISLMLRDSITGAAVVAQETAAIATDGMYVETASPIRGGQVGLAYERAGTYRVEATATGYKSWVQNGVRVTRDDCHVRTVELLARMQPGP